LDATIAAGGTAATLRINVLGGFAFRAGDGVVSLPHQAERVLALLAVSHREQRREGLIGRLWPELVQERAQACLRSALWRVRRIEPAVLDVSANFVRISPAVKIDLDEATHFARPSQRHSTLAPVEALALLREDLLPEWDDEWVVFERERVRQLRIHALEALSAALSKAGRFGEAIEAACVAIAAEPLRDSAHAALIEAHLAEGNRGEAARAFHRYAQLMKAELGVPPAPRVASLVRAAVSA
jgi:SARP family transcriptional regulator, regulator of embCAB operon